MLGRREGKPGPRTARTLLVLVGCALLLAVNASPSRASSAVVARDTGKLALSKLETGGWSAKLGLTNLTSDTVKLSVSSARPVLTAFCTVQFETGSTATLEAARDESVTATYSKGCKIGKEGAMLRVSTDTQPPQTLELAVDPPTKAPKPDWKVLWAFVIALVIALVVLFVMLFTNEHMTFGTRLPHLPATWTFKESWATNVTAGGGILTVVIGSTSVVKAFLGTEADSSIALATVGAGVAGAFLAFGALLVKTIRYTDSESPTAGGFVVGAACTLAGAFGELVTMYATGRKLDLGGLQHGLLPIVILIGAVLVVYAIISVRSTLEIGTKIPSAPLSQGTVAAVYLASECCDGVGNPDVVFRQIEEHLSPKVKVAKKARGKFQHPRSDEGEVAPPKRVGAALL
jgi:uncharacterized integral membrane protein